jgi:hypothetical protein
MDTIRLDHIDTSNTIDKVICWILDRNMDKSAKVLKYIILISVIFNLTSALRGRACVRLHKFPGAGFYCFPLL